MYMRICIHTLLHTYIHIHYVSIVYTVYTLCGMLYFMYYLFYSLNSSMSDKLLRFCCRIQLWFLFANYVLHMVYLMWPL